MDGTALGTLLLGVGAVATAVVAWVGKRGEHQLARASGDSTRVLQLLDQVQEERDGLREQLRQRDERITELLEDRLAEQLQMTRYRVRLIELGEDIDPP
jgi:TolA-binding protein